MRRVDVPERRALRKETPTPNGWTHVTTPRKRALGAKVTDLAGG